MQKIMIKDKLKELGYELKDIPLGDFDTIGEYTAKKNRDVNSKLYKSAGCFFRPNYERGILMYHLVKKFKLKSVLEIGFGRGYSALCMAKAMCDMQIDGQITCVDPFFNKDQLNQIFNIFPKEWFEKINFIGASSLDYYSNNNDEKFDFVFIDGDHRHDYVLKDWEFAEKNCSNIVLFDDYHLPTKVEKDIEVSKIVDKITKYKKELIVGDRRIFFDDRGLSDSEIDYGQVLVTLSEKAQQ